MRLNIRVPISWAMTDCVRNAFPAAPRWVKTRGAMTPRTSPALFPPSKTAVDNTSLPPALAPLEVASIIPLYPPFTTLNPRDANTFAISEALSNSGLPGLGLREPNMLIDRGGAV